MELKYHSDKLTNKTHQTYKKRKMPGTLNEINKFRQEIFN